VRQIANYHKIKLSPSYTRCSENQNNTSAENRKIGAIWRRIKKFEYHPL